MKNIRQNLFWAFAYNSLGVPIAAGILYPFFGILLSPIIAAAAMSFSSVTVIGNALRLRKLDIYTFIRKINYWFGFEDVLNFLAEIFIIIILTHKRMKEHNETNSYNTNHFKLNCL